MDAQTAKPHQTGGAARHREVSIGDSPDDLPTYFLFTPHQRVGKLASP